jgi:hypothetical protein
MDYLEVNIGMPLELHIKLWASKVVGVPILGISGLSLRSPVTK